MSAVPKLVGLAEIGEALGLSPQAAWNLTRRRTFPAPVQTLRMGKVWEEEKVRVWAETHGREWRNPA